MGSSGTAVKLAVGEVVVQVEEMEDDADKSDKGSEEGVKRSRSLDRVAERLAEYEGS